MTEVAKDSLPSCLIVTAGLAAHGFELAADPTETPTQLRLTGRVHKPRIPTWMLTIETLCVGALSAPWTVDISQHHFVQKPMAELMRSGAEPMNGSHVRFAWRIIFQSPDGIYHQYAAIAALLHKVQPPRTEIMQVSLRAPPNRNELTRGKGVRPVGANTVSGPVK